MSGDDYCRNLGRWMSCPPPLLERNLFLSDSGGGRSEEDGGGARWHPLLHMSGGLMLMVMTVTHC
jgi:hypothetical protein